MRSRRIFCTKIPGEILNPLPDRPVEAPRAAARERDVEKNEAVEDRGIAAVGGRARDAVRAGLRSLAASPHVIFYRVTPDEVSRLSA